MSRNTIQLMKKLIYPLAAIVTLSLMVPVLQLALSPEMALVQSADAQIKDKGSDIPKDFTTEDNVYKAVNQVARFLFNIALGLAVIFIIVAALFYLIAAGNQTQLDRAKTILIYSIVAVVLALIAGGITTFVDSLLKTGLK